MKDLTGLRFGNWTVLSFSGKDKFGNGLWECRCDCGTEKVVKFGNLVRRPDPCCRSCFGPKISKLKYKHGMRHTRPYRIWANMLQRGKNPGITRAKHYSLRGITVCPEWQTFEGFWADMQSGYADHLSIDRIDNNKGYFSGNCRWATNHEQRINR